jgi:serine/threonine-protein kinase
MSLPHSSALIAGKYRIESLLGEGGMGAVFRARHEVMDKAVAVKWLKPTFGDQAAAKRRFMQEARAAARIRHPNVVDVYDVGEQDDCLFMVMELLEGMTFDDYLERQDFSGADALRHLLSAMRGVAAAHAVGITHRDIKPENIFIASDPLHVDGLAKILDFGISKLHDDPIEPRLSTPGLAMGTPHYMSVEQLRGSADVDHRTDIYAFGVLLYQALTGVLPYNGGTISAIILEASLGRAVHPVELCPKLPWELGEVVMRAIALDKEDRFASMDEMIAALERIVVAPRAESTFTRSFAAQVATALPPQAPGERFAWRTTVAPLLSIAWPDPRAIHPWLVLAGIALGVAAGGAAYSHWVGRPDRASQAVAAPVTVAPESPTPPSLTISAPSSERATAPKSATNPLDPALLARMPTPSAPLEALASTSSDSSPPLELEPKPSSVATNEDTREAANGLAKPVKAPRSSQLGSPARAAGEPAASRRELDPSIARSGPSEPEASPRSATDEPASTPARASAAGAQPAADPFTAPHRSGTLRREDL